MTDGAIDLEAPNAAAIHARPRQEYRLTVESIPLGVMSLDPQGIILDANSALLSIFDLEPTDLLHATSALSFEPFVQAGLDSLVRQCLESGEAMSAEHPYSSEGGKSAYLRLYVTPERDDQYNVTFVQVIVVDISEYKQTEELLWEYQRRLEGQNAELHKLSQALEQSANMVIITDLNGRIEYVNPKFTEITGYAADEVQGQNSRILKSGEQDDTYYRLLWQTITSGNQWRGEFHNRRKDGTLYWEQASIAPIYDARGRMTHFVAIKEDITERKRASEDLQRYNERLKILHEIDQAVLAAQLPETIAVAAIHRFRRLIPCQRVMVIALEEDGQVHLLAAESNAEISPVDDLSMYEDMFGEHPLRSGLAAGSQDLVALPQRSSLQEALYEAGMRSYIAVPLFIQGKLVGILSLESTQPKAFSSDDITIAIQVAASLAVAIRQAQLYARAQQEIAERMQAEATLRRRTAELEARNAELDAFAHTVAHDLKNPLSSIVGYADVLKKEYAAFSPETREQGLQVIARNARKMAAIIDELLLLSSVRGMKEIEIYPLDMDRIVAEARGRLMHQIEEYQGEIVVPSSWPVALGYGPWVEAVWTNYISNALKYGGQPPRVELGAVPQEDGWIRFWVCDNGPGLSAEQKARLFTPFERLHQVRVRGHGLGLSIVQRIVKRLGGQVGVDSEGTLGQGSRFYFTLPAMGTNGT